MKLLLVLHSISSDTGSTVQYNIVFINVWTVNMKLI